MGRDALKPAEGSKPRQPQPDQSVTATDFKNRTGRYIDQAGRSPVVITRHSRPSRVLIDYDEYARLRERASTRPTREAIKAEDLSAGLIEAISAAEYSHLGDQPDKPVR